MPGRGIVRGQIAQVQLLGENHYKTRMIPRQEAAKLKSSVAVPEQWAQKKASGTFPTLPVSTFKWTAQTGRDSHPHHGGVPSSKPSD